MIDGMNRRVGKRVNGALVQGFLYAGQLSPIAELDGSQQVVSRFIYGARGNVPAYMIKAGITYRLITDHLGSVRLVVNASDGTVAQRVDYDEFGRVTQNTAPSFQPFGYAGGLLDNHTGLTRFGARDYDAVIGRWTAKEPLGFSGGYANLYAYVGSDPVNLIDPSGTTQTPCGDIPKAPPGADIDKNIIEAEWFLNPLRFVDPKDWDYKRQGKPATETEPAEFEDFGNFKLRRYYGRRWLHTGDRS